MASQLSARRRPGHTDLGVVMRERPRLISLAYRALGSLTDAEDAVQEAYARWCTMAPDQQQAIGSPAAWLTTVTTRICLDVLRSARVRREMYVGEWIPEPVPDGEPPVRAHLHAPLDLVDRVTLGESLDMACMVLLDSMTPAERVAFLLHDVFRYPFAEVGEMLGRTPAACRQLATSARRRIRRAERSAVPRPQRAGIIRDFKRAWESMDVGALINVLDPDATLIADGGGIVHASLVPIEGAGRIAPYLVHLATLVGGVTLHERNVNGQPGLVGTHGGATATVFAFDIDSDRIRRVWAVRNPEKLRAWRAA